ncbi:MAG: hypothetical protein FWC41_00730 [Firmicutes bacterium]|nr:hypothetical protein [Bacillota bacterium]
MVFNQNFTLSWNTIWQNLSRRIGEDLIKRTEYTSPFSEFVRQLELGNYVQESYINPAQIFLHDTVINSDILTDHTDTILTTVHEVNVDLNIPSTYKEYVVRTSFNFWDNINALVASLVANLRVTSEIAKNNIIKQMLFNAWSYGMLDTKLVTDPRISDQDSERYVIAINSMIDDMLTEANNRYLIYNNQSIITSDSQKAIGIGKSVPYVIMFNDFLRTVEVLNALQMVFGRYKETSGNDNQDYARRLIRLNFDDFPQNIPSTPRSQVTGSNVPYNNINFFEMPINTATGQPLFDGSKKQGDLPIAFILEPESLILRSQLDLQTNFTNPATLATTNRLILRLVVSLSGFDKIGCVAMNRTITTTKATK